MIWIALSLGKIDLTSALLWLMAWFVTIGLHEGGHAWVAYWLGDDTAYKLGKRSLNPLRHIDFNNNTSLVSTVVIPVVTVLAIGWPLGIAWVPVNPSNFKHPTRDMAITALAGPGGNVIGALLGFGVLFAGVSLAVATSSNLQLHAFSFLRGSTVGIDLLAHFGLRLMILNVILGLINLVPIPGVDGGSVAFHFMNQRARHIYEQLRPYGFLIFIVVVWFLLQKQVTAVFLFAAVDIPNWIFKLLGGA